MERKMDENGKFMFIYPDIGGRGLNFSPAIEILSSYMTKERISVSMIHLNYEHGVHPEDYEEIIRRIEKFQPDVVGVTSTTFQYPVSCKVAEKIKEYGWKGLLVLGGIHATIAPNDLADSPFDAFSIGEGEITLTTLMKKYVHGENITNIKGLHIKSDGRIITNGYPEVLEDLDVLPVRDYEIINAKKILELSKGWFSVSFSRGCPYACKFCINQKLRKDFMASTKIKYYRCQSVSKVIDDLLQYIDAYPAIRMFNFDDDLLIMDKKWFSEFAEEYRIKIYKKYGIKYVINTRANLITEDVVKKLKASGCHECQVGFETGNEELRNDVLSKEITNAQLEKAFDLFNEYKVRSLAYTMLGIPGESKNSIKETIKELVRLKPTLIRMTFFEPFIGTPLYDYCIENNLFNDSYLNIDNFTKSVVKMDDITNYELSRYHLLFPWYLNMEINEDEIIQSKYGKLIERYIGLSEKEIDDSAVKEKIIKKDHEISEFMTERGISHFRYFPANKNYFNYCICD